MHKAILIFIFSWFVVLSAAFSQQKPDKISRFHHKILTLDSHTDTPLRLGRSGFDIGKRNDGGKVDFPRMKEGGLDAVFFAVFIGQGKRDSLGHIEARDRAFQIFDKIDLVLQQYPEQAELALNANDAGQIAKRGKSAVFIGIENGYPIGNDLRLVETFYNRGARYITLSHSYNNDICDSSTDDKGPEYNGLSPFGEEVVKEMNRLGMMIDVSHISDSAFYDVLRLSSQPVIASHSNARTVCNHPRNLTDDMLLALKENGGVVQLCVLSDYVKKMPENPKRDSAFAALRKKYNGFKGISDEQMDEARKEWYATDQLFPANLASVSDLVDHVDHIVNLIGIDYVGIGTDFDGGGALSDCYDVTELDQITRELFRRGYSKKDIKKIWSGNFLRVFHQVEQTKDLVLN